MQEKNGNGNWKKPEELLNEISWEQNPEEEMVTKNVDESINEQREVLRLRKKQLEDAEKNLKALEQLKENLVKTENKETINKYYNERLDAIDSASDLVETIKLDIGKIEQELERLIGYKKTIFDTQKKY